MKTFKIASLAEENITNNCITNHFKSLGQDFKFYIEGNPWMLEFHNTGKHGELDGEVEVCDLQGHVIGYADVVCDQNGHITITNMATNSSYRLNANVFKNMAGFIKRACYCIAKVNYLMACKKSKQHYYNRNNKVAAMKQAKPAMVH